MNKKKKLKSLSFRIPQHMGIMCGMVLLCLTSSLSNTRLNLASGNARDYSINLVSPKSALRRFHRKTGKKIRIVESLKKLKELFTRKKTRVVFQDEVHFTVEATITRQWFPKGSCPKVKSYPGRKSVAYSGFVTYGTGELFVAKPTWFNYETTIASIREFLAATKLKRGEKLILVMDNAPWHKKAKRLIENERGYADIHKKLTIVSLPPYSPDLNPIEQVWRVTRREKTHNRYWKNLEVLTTTLDDWFSTFSKPNDKLASLCSFSW